MKLSAYDGPDHVLTDADYRTAIAVQDACNASGLCHSMPDVAQRIGREARARGEGTSWANRHPIMQLYASKLHDLAGMGLSDVDRYGDAYQYCRDRASQPDPASAHGALVAA